MGRKTVLGVGLLWFTLLLGCGDDTDIFTGGNGAGATGSGNSGTGGTLFPTGGAGGSAAWNPQGGGNVAGNCASDLMGTIRDFSPTTHPDFEYIIQDDRGIVEDELGSDMKPVYAGDPTTPTTHGQQYFDQWFRDTEGVNEAIPLSITLTPAGGGVYTYDNGDFFPIDGQGLGNEGRPHNFHFTYEIHASFTYEGGEVFTFTGDDDLFTFVNGRLAIDLGGVHGAENQTIDMDAQADALGISVGGTYALDFFFAERHTTESNFRIDTSIPCFEPVTPPS